MISTIPTNLFPHVLWILAAISIIIFLFQTSLLLFFDTSDHDCDIHDASDHVQHDTGHSFGFFTFKNIVNFLMVFSITGLIFDSYNFPKPLIILFSTLSGLLFSTAMILLMNLLYKLRHDPTPSFTELISRPGSCYLKIPSSGIGKIKIYFGGSIKVLDAYSEDGDIETNDLIIVSKIEGTSIFVKKQQVNS